jgi:hypothetical protein
MRNCLQTMSEVARATLRQHYSRSPRPSRNEPTPPESKEEAPNFNATTNGALA